MDKGFVLNQNSVDAICPRPIGWLEYKLSQTEIDYLWDCVANKGDTIPIFDKLYNLHTFQLYDKNNWFFNNSLLPLLNRYINEFKNMGEEFPINSGYAPYYLDNWWVNYQPQGVLNPLHTHGSVYSFAIWLKIPTEHKEQNNNPLSQGIPRLSSFEFAYCDILGRINTFTYPLNKSDPIKMLLFPSSLHHMVYPFYNSDEERVTISGNISLDTRPGYSGGTNG